MSAYCYEHNRIDTSKVEEFVERLLSALSPGKSYPHAFLENPAGFVESCGLKLAITSAGPAPDTSDYVICLGVSGDFERVAAAVNAENGGLQFGGFSNHELPSLANEPSFYLALERGLKARGSLLPFSRSSSEQEASATTGAERYLQDLASASSCPHLTKNMILAGSEVLWERLNKECVAETTVLIYEAMYKARCLG